MPRTTSLLLSNLFLVSTALGTVALADDEPTEKVELKTVPGMTVLLVDSREEPAEKHTDAERPTIVTAKASGELVVEEDGFLLGKVNIAFEEGVSAGLSFHAYRDETRLWSDSITVRSPRDSRNLDFSLRSSLPTRNSFAFPVRKGDVVKWSYLRSPYELEPSRFRAGAEFGRLAFRAFPPTGSPEPDDQ